MHLGSWMGFLYGQIQGFGSRTIASNIKNAYSFKGLHNLNQNYFESLLNFSYISFILLFKKFIWKLVDSIILMHSTLFSSWGLKLVPLFFKLVLDSNTTNRFCLRTRSRSRKGNLTLKLPWFCLISDLSASLFIWF